MDDFGESSLLRNETTVPYKGVRSTQRQREVNPRNRNRDRGRGRGRESGVLVWQRAGQVCYLGRGATGPAGVGN